MTEDGGTTLAKITNKIADYKLSIRSAFVFFLVGNLFWMYAVAFSADGSGRQKMGLLGLVSGAALITGSFLGFLFGIPRSLASHSAALAQGKTTDGQTGVIPNTNLEQISDWLTKIIVGVSLTQITQLSTMLSSLEVRLGKLLEFKHGGIAGVATVVAFGMAGFIWVYFESRTSMMKVFHHADSKSSDDV